MLLIVFFPFFITLNMNYIYICQLLPVFFTTCYLHATFTLYFLYLISLVASTMLYVALFYSSLTGEICQTLPMAIWEATTPYGNLYSTVALPPFI